MPSLSTTQRVLLAKLAVPDTRLVRWLQFKGAYFKEAYGDPEMVLVATADVLIRQGLVREYMSSASFIVYVISDSGYAALGMSRPKRRTMLDVDVARPSAEIAQ